MRWTRSILAMLMICMGMAVWLLPMQPATATPWLTVSDVWPGDFTTAPNGNVTVGCGDNRDLVTYDSAGNTVRQLDRTQTVDGVPNCIQKPVVDQDGNLYGQPVDGQGQVGPNMLAYEGSNLLWKYPVTCSVGAQSGIAVGADGNIYVLTDTGAGLHLVGLDPVLQPNETQPLVVMDTAVNASCSSVLRPYDDGIAVDSGTNISLYDYSGTLTGQVSNPYSGWVSVNADGEVFVPSSYDGQVLSKYDKTGQKEWDYDAGVGIDASFPMSDGSTMLFMSHPDNSVRKVSGNGDVLGDDVTLVPDSIEATISPMHMVASNKGQLVYVAGVYEDHVLSSSIVGVLSSSMRIQSQIEVDDHGASTMTGPGAIRITRDRVFFQAGGVFMPSVLVGITASDVGFDYPRSSVFGVEDSSLNYVAMGDSFSSGEGNPAFNPWTDRGGVNECHRSQDHAYPTLLANDSSLNLDLVDFVACSGATMDDVFGNAEPGDPLGKGDEPAQIDAINGDTDVVTITIGGNDVGFSDYILDCLWECGPGDPAYTTIMSNINVLQFKLELKSTYSEILERLTNPNARLLVVDYPNLAGSNSSGMCNWIDYSGAYSVQNALNDVIETAVDEVDQSDSRIELVDTNAAGSPFAGRHLCNGDPSTEDFNGFISNNWEYSFHPNNSGHQHYKEVVADALN